MKLIRRQVLRFYQQLQLNQAGSKKLIADTTAPKLKVQRTGIYIFKVMLTVAFCFCFVTAFSVCLGSENSIIGVVTLLCILVMRQVNFSIDPKHSIAVLLIVFGIFAAGPRISNMLPAGGALIVNLVCIFTLVLTTCHNVIMSNHSTFVLCYLLLQGYDVSGHAYQMRLIGLLVGGIITITVFYRNHHMRKFEADFSNLFSDFDITSARSQWQIKFTLTVSILMFILSVVGINRVMWAGIAAMSLMSPMAQDMSNRLKYRAPYNVIGCALFLLLSLILPANIFAYVGIIGGIGVGFSAKYNWQTVFNTFGALYIAAGLYGIPAAIFLRIFHNAIASVFTVLSDKIFNTVTSNVLSTQYQE